MSEVQIEKEKIAKLKQIPAMLKELQVSFTRINIPKVYMTLLGALFIKIDIFIGEKDYHFIIKENIPVGRLEGEIYYQLMNIKRLSQTK